MTDDDKERLAPHDAPRLAIHDPTPERPHDPPLAHVGDGLRAAVAPILLQQHERARQEAVPDPEPAPTDASPPEDRFAAIPKMQHEDIVDAFAQGGIRKDVAERLVLAVNDDRVLGRAPAADLQFFQGAQMVLGSVREAAALGRVTFDNQRCEPFATEVRNELAPLLQTIREQGAEAARAELSEAERTLLTTYRALLARPDIRKIPEPHPTDLHDLLALNFDKLLLLLERKG